MNMYCGMIAKLLVVFLFFGVLSALAQPQTLIKEARNLNRNGDYIAAAEKFVQAAEMYDAKNWRKADTLFLAYKQYIKANQKQKADELAIKYFDLSHTFRMLAFIHWHKNKEYQKIYDSAKALLNDKNTHGSVIAGNLCGAMLLGAQDDSEKIAEVVKIIEHDRRWGYIVDSVYKTGSGMQLGIWSDEDGEYFEKNTLKVLEKAVFTKSDVRKNILTAFVYAKINEAGKMKDKAQRCSTLKRILTDYVEMKKDIARSVASEFEAAGAYKEAEKLYRELDETYHVIRMIERDGRVVEAFAEVEKALQRPEKRTDDLYAYAKVLAMHTKIKNYEKAVFYAEKQYKSKLAYAKKINADKNHLKKIKAEYYNDLWKAYSKLGKINEAFEALDNYLEYPLQSWEKEGWFAPFSKASVLIEQNKIEKAQQYIKVLEKLSSGTTRDRYRSKDCLRDLKQMIAKKSKSVK